MKRIAVFALILVLISPVARALNADAVDTDALNDAIARVNLSLREAGNHGYVSWAEGTEEESPFAYFAVALPFDEVTTDRYAGETLDVPPYVNREITFFYCLDIDPPAPWILIQSTSFPREEIVPHVVMDGKPQEVDWQFYDQGDCASIYLFPSEQQMVRWLSASELLLQFQSGNTTIYVTVTPETYAGIYQLYAALMGCVRYANRDSNAYLNAARLPALPAANAQDMPKSGKTTIYTERISAGFLTIAAPRGDFYYYIVLAQPNEPHEKLATVLIHPGETAKIRVPEGEYAVYYARGTEWYGDFSLFGTGTAYYAMEGTVSVRLGAPGSGTELIAIPAENPEIDPAGFPF